MLIVLGHPSVLGRAINNGEVELVLGGVEREHKVEHHFVHLLRATVRLVHLVYYNYRLKSQLQSLLQYKSCLRHRTLEGVYQQNAAVCHIKHTLHLAAKVGVSRSVNNIDFSAFPVDRNVFGKDSYSSFALQVIGIQHLATVILAVAEKLSRQHHLVHKCGLAMVYVSYYGNVSNVLHLYIPYNKKLSAKLITFVRIEKRCGGNLLHQHPARGIFEGEGKMGRRG